MVGRVRARKITAPIRRDRSSQTVLATALCATCRLCPIRNNPRMKVAVVKERRALERRVAASPDSVKRMVGMGLEVAVEAGAGAGAGVADASFAEAGGVIVADAAAAL